MPSKRRLLGFAVVLSVGPAAFVACTTSSRPPIEDTGPAYPSQAAGGSGGDDAGVASCYGSDAGCSNLALCGGKIFVTEVAQAAPTASGGTIVPGLYSMTKYVIYTGAGGASGTLSNWFKQTLVLASPSLDGDAGDARSPVDADAGAADARAADAGATLDAGDDASAVTLEGGTEGETYSWLDATESDTGSLADGSGSVVTLGTSIVFQLECASASSLAGSYTATTTAFVAYYDDPGSGTAAVTYSLMQ